MLHRTYGPLLWRGITSASSIVRVRSASVLADTFPLRDPNAENGTKAVVKSSVCVSGTYGKLGSLSPSRGECGDSASAEPFLGDDTDRGYSDVIESNHCCTCI